MARTTTTLTISMSPEMAGLIELAMRREHRTRSELVREALRQYLRDVELAQPVVGQAESRHL